MNKKILVTGATGLITPLTDSGIDFSQFSSGKLADSVVNKKKLCYDKIELIKSTIFEEEEL